MEHDFLGPSSQKCLGATEKGSPVFPDGMFQTKNGNWCSISLKPSMIPVSGLCGVIGDHESDQSYQGLITLSQRRDHEKEG